MRFFIPGNIYENQEKMREIQSAEWGGEGTEQVMRGLSPHFTSVSCHRRWGEGGGEQTVLAIDSSRLAVSVSV